MLIDVKLKQPYVAGSEASLEKIQDFVDALHFACAKFEEEQALIFIRQCARERGSRPPEKVLETLQDF